MASFGDPFPVNLRFLTDDESLRSFAKRYWCALFGRGATPQFKETVAEIIGELGWKQNEAINRLAAIVEVTYGTCNQCGEKIVVRNRSELYDKASRSVCRPCLEKYAAAMQQERAAYSERCRQQEELRRQAGAAASAPPPRVVQVMTTAEIRLAHVSQRFRPALRAVNTRDMSLDDAVHLTTIFKASQSKRFNFVNPLSDSMKHGCKNPATPGSLFTTEIPEYLYKRGIIGIAPESQAHAFNWNENHTIKTYIPERVLWSVAPSISGVHLIEELRTMFRSDRLPSHWWPGVIRLWRLIARYECVEFWTNQLKRYRLSTALPKRVYAIIDDGLETHSVSQLYTLIWRSAKDAAAKYHERNGKISTQDAADFLVDGVEYLIGRARGDRWKIDGLSRNYDCPRSIISEVLFDIVLQIGNVGFDGVPREYAELEKQAG